MNQGSAFQRSYLTGTLLLACLGLFPAIARAGTNDDLIQIQSYPTHDRLLLQVDDGVEVQWRNLPTGFQALLRGLTLTDLGAPLGSEAEWAAQLSQSQSRVLENAHDPRLASLEVKETHDGVLIEGSWKFARGQKAPAQPRMETFDYREHGPGRFVVDFWVKPGPTRSEAEALQRKRAQAAAQAKTRAGIRARLNRRIAEEKALAEAYQVDEFCSQPLNESHDVFLPFRAAHEKVDYSRHISSTTPDSQFSYFEPDGGARDAEYVRLALSLYRQGKQALVIRTLDFLDTEVPRSQYRIQMHFLRANALIKLGLQKEADRILERLTTEAKGSPEALQAGMYRAARLATQDQPLLAQEAFFWLIGNYPAHRLNWLFHLGAAESLSAIGQAERAAKEYQWVIENGPTVENRVDAASRLGDIYLNRRQYEQALAAYADAERRFKDEAASLPPLSLNRGEALYQMGQYAEAQKVFEAYTKKFPSYPEGWRATFRLGEIRGRLPGKADQEASRRYFYDTINQYPFSAGSTLARLRLLPCGDHGGYTAEAADRFFDTEAKTFEMPESVAMVHYHDLYALSRLRSLITMGREDLAVEAAVQEIPVARIESVKRALKQAFFVLFRRKIMTLLDQGQPYEALAFYNAHLENVGLNAGAGEPGYLLRLSDAASDLGLGKLADSIYGRYPEATGRKPGGAGREIASTGATANPPGIDGRLAASQKGITEAKALWVEGGDPGQSRKIRELLSHVDPESPHSYEKEIILGLMEERAGNLSAALAHAAQAQLLLPAENLAVLGWLASLQSRAGHRKEALQTYRMLDQKLAAKRGASANGKDPEVSGEARVLGVPELPSLEEIRLSEGSVLEKLGRWSESAELYSRAIKQGMGGNQLVFSYARALLRTGKPGFRPRAIAALEGLSTSKTEDFWKKMAGETLEDLRLQASRKTGQ